MSNLDRDLTYELNRLAGTLLNGAPTLQAQAAANIWAGTSSLDLVGALNARYNGANAVAANAATGTDTSANTTGFTFSGGTGASSTAQFWQGARSLLLTASGTAAMNAQTPASGSYMTASPAVTYTGMFYARRGVGTRNALVQLYWYNSSNGTVSSPTGGTVTLSSSAWTKVTYTAVAPATTAKARLYVVSTTGATSDTLYIDGISFHPGANTNWTTPAASTFGLTTGWLGLNAVCNALAGTTNLDPASALRSIT